MRVECSAGVTADWQTKQSERTLAANRGGNAELNEGALVGTGGVHTKERELTGRSVSQRRL